ncbi:unnamed protein product [Ranitomeya imitator]|uniref:Taste receptor type 2 n=1 Tax=Ranitomeya imitator TaxID=111125 RepID=A0ABN9KYL7_9NEOB|nr:unnamed protein product [Ranitomeya imitator]
MTILGASTIFGVLTNLLIVTVNFVDKVKGRKLNPSDLIMVTLGSFNVFFQFIMLINDYIIIFTHPVLIRLKLGVSQLIPKLLMASVFTSVANGIPAAWYRYKDHLSLNISSNQGLEPTVPKVNVVYMLPSTIISSSLPLTLIGIVNGIIIKSLLSHSHKEDRNANGDLRQRAEARVRAARTIGSLLLLYIAFYVSEILLFTDTFPRNSPGFCACLMVIYIYPPAQSMVLITGSPKLKQVSIALLWYLVVRGMPAHLRPPHSALRPPPSSSLLPPPTYVSGCSGSQIPRSQMYCTGSQKRKHVTS